MELYNVNQKKRKKVLKQIVKENIKNIKGFPKFCYGLTIVLRVLACILGLANIVYVISFSSYMVDLLFLIVTFGFPYGLSFISAVVYIMTCSVEYRLRTREEIALANDGFVYSYHDNRVGLNDTIFAFRVLYGNIQRFEYDTKTSCITLYGNILLDTYERGERSSSDKYNEISLLNIFDVDVKQLLEENC